MDRFVDANSHLFRGLPDNVARYRRLVAEPAVERVVVSGADLKLAHSDDFPYMSTFATSNEDVLALIDAVGGDKLVPWCFLDPRDPRAVAELEACVRRGMRGVKMYPPMGFDADDPRAMAVYAAAEALGLPVFLHMGRTAAHPGLRSAHARPLALEAVGLAHPRLTLVIGHFAAPWSLEAFYIAMGFPCFRFDLSTSGHWDPAMLRLVIDFDRHEEEVGLSRLVYGSNGDGANNLAIARRTCDRLAAAGFTDAELRAIFLDNPRALVAATASAER